MQHLAVSSVSLSYGILWFPNDHELVVTFQYLSHFPVLLESLESLECPIVLCEKTPWSTCARPLLFGLLNGFLLLKGRNLTGFVGIQVSPPDFKLHLGNKHQKKNIKKKNRIAHADAKLNQSRSRSPVGATFSAETGCSKFTTTLTESIRHSPSPSWKTRHLCHSVKPTFVQALKHP